ncbi:transglycosylase domain-containing protein [Arcanobacterium haemolyticum]|nr:transglycosylase domain-containing protein [Arcanobacterium haemolyticum]
MPTSRNQGATGRQIATFTAAILAVCLAGGALLAGLAMPAVTAVGTAVNAGTSVFEEVPANLGFTEPSEQSIILASDGTPLATFYAENRIVVASDQISQSMKDAVVAIEDRRFYEHHGIDLQGLMRAFVNNVTGGNLAGGSSITQQYVKNALIEQGRINNDDELIDQATERTIGRKINEARYAIGIERTMSKDEILTGYLNLAQFGTSSYGVETASLRYFSKHASELTVVEAATLAGITQSPARWDPIRHPEDSQTRRDVVLGEMLSLGFITQEQYDEAVNTPIADMLHISEPSNGCASAGISAYFCEYVVKDILKDDSWGTDQADRVSKLYRGGLTIQSTLNPTRQQAAYDSLVTNIPVNDGSGTQTAISSVEPNTGYIVAMAQNTNYGTSTETDPTATQMNLNASSDMGGGIGYQSGSTFKIYTLIEWLKQGHSASEVIDSSSKNFPKSAFTISCSPQSADNYKIVNLEGVGGGPMTVLESTRRSVNASFVYMATKLDLCNIANNALETGVQRGDNKDWSYAPSMVLGANNVTPLSMATSVATLAAEGNYCKPTSYTKILDASGDTLTEKAPNCRQVLDKDLVRKTTAVLNQVVSRGATGENAQVAGRQVAGKTGTSNNDYDAWFVGYTPQLAAAVWHGHMTGQVSMFNSVINGKRYGEVYGGLFPATIFGQYMTQALSGQPVQNFTAPSSAVAPTPTPTATEEPTQEPAAAEAEAEPEGVEGVDWEWVYVEDDGEE